MNIDYNLINDQLNEYAIDKIYEILSKYEIELTDEEVTNFGAAIFKNKIIIVDQPNEEDYKLFNGNIPSAHGPRTKNDGYIHIYPYKYSKLNTEEIINRYIEEGIILHELYHFIIKLDIKNQENVEEEFGHYLTEGMVQLFTEMHERKQYKSSGYRKNVISANSIYRHLNNDNNINMLFKRNYKEIFAKYPELSILFDEYKKETAFMKELEKILSEISKIINIDEKRLINKMKTYTIDETIINFKDVTAEYLNQEEERYFNDKLDTLYLEIFNKNEKRL